MSEFFRLSPNRVLIGALLSSALVVGPSGCVETAPNTGAPIPPQPTAGQATETPNPTPTSTLRPDLEITHEYTEGGQMITNIHDPENDSAIYPRTLSYCESGDLVEVVPRYYTDTAGSTPFRSYGHVACADGVLTPSDFGE
jgi:hypothetical protein